MKITNAEVAPLCDTFFIVFDFTACTFNNLDDKILIFSGGNYRYFYDHTKN